MSGGVYAEIAYLEPGSLGLTETIEGHLCATYSLAHLWVIEQANLYRCRTVTSVTMEERPPVIAAAVPDRKKKRQG